MLAVPLRPSLRQVPGESKPLPAISLMELRVFVRKAALTSPYLNLTQIELMLPSIDGLRRVSHSASPPPPPPHPAVHCLRGALGLDCMRARAL